jgi:DNA polymerase-3 subunit alpha
MNNYVVYHLHSDLSLLDSCTKFTDYINKAKELGQTAICFSEHGNIYNWVDKKMHCEKVVKCKDCQYAKENKYSECNQCDKYDSCIDRKSIKYIHGVEIYLTETLKENIRDNYHTILIARNFEGVKEVNSLLDLSTQPDHFYYKNRISFDEFLKISDNVIKISACLASPLNRLSDLISKLKNEASDIQNEYFNIAENKEAERFIDDISLEYHNKFNSIQNKIEKLELYYEKILRHYDYYEIQPHISEDQKIYNLKLYEWSKAFNKPLIAGTDTHSLNTYKAECRSILQKAKKIEYSDEDKFDLTYKSFDELVDMFRKQNCLEEEVFLEAINNTNVMAESVEEFKLDTTFKYPILYDNEEEVLNQRIEDNYNYKLKNNIITDDKIYLDNIIEENRVLKKIGMTGFILFMSELMTWCRENNIPFCPCRGSVGGSTIAYILDIIDLNPVVWDTVFSRFANEDRVEIGDIDVDISPSQRELVYQYIINRFGIDYTAYILAIGTISDKGTIDEIGRALHYKWISLNKEKIENKELSETDSPYHIKQMEIIKKEYDEKPDYAKSKYKDIFYYFDGLLNTSISQSMHPAGIIASPITLPDNYGTFWSDGKRIISINMEEVHEVSLVKYDILGLKNIEIIKDTCALAGIKYPLSHEINWNDNDVWNDIITSKVGIFQFEGNYAFDLLKKYKPQKINDLSLVNAALRPSGESYRDKLITREININPSKQIDDLLKDNNGFLVFQEDTIKFLQDICGLSGSEADNIRRAIGRKQRDRLEKALPQILEGYCNKSDKPREVAEKEAKEFLQIIENSADYQFGYNHSTGYSMIGYLCAYYRYYYPIEFITAYLNNAQNQDDINAGTELARIKNIHIKPIKFRYSTGKYFPDKSTNSIYKGISSIKYCNEKIAEELYNLRDKQYNTFVDLLVDIEEITSINSRQLDILIRLNFFDEFGKNKKLLTIYKEFSSGKNKYDKKHKDKTKQQRILALYEFEKSVEDISLTINEQIEFEQEILGTPMTKYDLPKCVFILSVDIKNSPKLNVYGLNTGKLDIIKIEKKIYKKNEVKAGDIIYIKKHKFKPRAIFVGNDEKGKPIFKHGTDKECWLEEYTIKNFYK